MPSILSREGNGAKGRTPSLYFLEEKGALPPSLRNRRGGKDAFPIYQKKRKDAPELVEENGALLPSRRERKDAVPT